VKAKACLKCANQLRTCSFVLAVHEGNKPMWVHEEKKAMLVHEGIKSYTMATDQSKNNGVSM
jgi:hypothetical protein